MNTSHGYQLLQASKFILTTFVDNCTQKKQQKTNSERTYWVKHIVRIFQSFANQTGYLQFKWCESQTKQHALAEINLNNWKKPTARFCDGLGFDWLGKERLLMEGSGGQHEEKIDHTISDTAKQISNTILMLKGFIRENIDASFETLRKVKIFGVQAIERMITLTEASYDEESTKYLYKVVRMARIPIDYEVLRRMGRLNLVVLLKTYFQNSIFFFFILTISFSLIIPHPHIEHAYKQVYFTQ